LNAGTLLHLADAGPGGIGHMTRRRTISLD